MTFTVIYFILMFFLTVYMFLKKVNVLGRLIFLVYTIGALLAIFAVYYGLTTKQNISLLPYLFLIISYCIFFGPFLKNKSICSAYKIVPYVDRKYILFAIFYIVCALISIKCYLPAVGRLMASGDWASNRMELYSENLDAPYSNMIEYYSIQISGYCRILATIVGFSLLRANSSKKITKKYTVINRIIGLLAIFTSIGYILCASIYSSARGTIFNVLVLVMAIYLFFYYEIDKNKRKFITILALLIIACIIPYLIEVTVSRFSSEGAANSVVWYLGQAPIVFNKFIFTLEKHAWGKYGIGILFGEEFSAASIGGEWGAGFFTFVGWLCIDWSPIGVIIIGVLSSYLVLKVIKKRIYQISDVFLIFTYYQILTNGVFVIGRTYVYTLIGSFVIYVLLKLVIEKKKYVVGKIKI